MINRGKLNQYWKGTEIIRQYQGMLFTFGDTPLPYVLAYEHKIQDRTIVLEGVIQVDRPTIILPVYMQGPKFEGGFQEEVPIDVVSLFRNFGFPSSHIHNQKKSEQKLESGCLSSVLERYDTRLENEGDTKTGLIKSIANGFEISLIRYIFQLAVQSTPGNVWEFMEHLRHQRGRPIGSDEHITDDEIGRLFE